MSHSQQAKSRCRPFALAADTGPLVFRNWLGPLEQTRPSTWKFLNRLLRNLAFLLQFLNHADDEYPQRLCILKTGIEPISLHTVLNTPEASKNSGCETQ